MTWIGEGKPKLPTIYDGTSIGKILEIESLQKYIIKMESIETDYKLKLMIEDSINRFNF
jgi:hypothetical protein